MSTDNGLQAWPDDWPWYKQACFSSWDDRCDMLVGPCRCGAGHAAGEFEYRDGALYRNGRTVPCYHPRTNRGDCPRCADRERELTQLRAEIERLQAAFYASHDAVQLRWNRDGFWAYDRRTNAKLAGPCETALAAAMASLEPSATGATC